MRECFAPRMDITTSRNLCGVHEFRPSQLLLTGVGVEKVGCAFGLFGG